MKNNTTSKMHQSAKALHLFLTSKIKIPWCFLILLLITLSAEAQTSAAYLTWDNEVGCQVSSNPDRKSYFELIEDGECLRVCQGSTVKYTLNGDNATWQITNWEVIGGTIINTTLTSCIVKWTTLTDASIGATITTTNGPQILPNLCIEKIKKPKAVFNKAPFNFVNPEQIESNAVINVCAGEVFTFQNGSNSNGGTPIIDYYWDFDDGTTSSAFEPSHSYPESGETHTVYLTVTNACNCQSTYKMDVLVGKKSVNIVCPAVVCEGQTANYSLSSNLHCENYNWSVLGGTITSEIPYSSTISIQWANHNELRVGSPAQNDGFGYVTFDPLSCGLDCYIPTTLKIPVISDNMPFEGPAMVCGNSQQRFTMPQWPTTDFVWEVINTGGTNASLVYTDQRNEVILIPGDYPGVVILKVTYQNTLLNCGGTYQKEINIKRAAIIDGAKETCLGSEEFYFIHTEEFVNWSLKKLPNGPTVLGAGSSFSNLFTEAGNYSLSVTGEDLCATESIIIKVKSVATPLDSEITDSDGDRNARIVCPSSPSIFGITNQIPGTIVGWSILSGVGTIVGSSYGNDIQVIFKYPTVPAGLPYTIKVWRESTTDPFCKSDDLTINLAPKNLDLVIDGEHYPCGSTYKTYSVPETTGDTYEWSLADPEAGSIQVNGSRSVTILWNQFPNAKQTSINLKVTKCNIPQLSTAFPITIDNPRIEIVTPIGPICPNSLQSFSITSIPPLNSSNAILWDFGDGSQPVSGNTSIQHSFDSNSTVATNYTIRVRVTQPNGCLLTLTKTAIITVSPTPMVVIAPSIYTVCSPNPINVTLIATPVVNTPPVSSIVWYKTGSTVPLSPLGGYTTSIVATSYGNYYAEISNGICTNTVEATVADCVQPCAVATIPTLTLNLTSTCTTIAATGTYAPTNPAPTGYKWGSNFLHDQVLPGATYTNATFSFEEPGNHKIDYGIAYNNELCYTYTSQNIFIPYVPKVEATISCGTNNYIATITNQSLVDSSVTLQNYVFELDNVTIPLGTNPATSRVIDITTPGTHTIRLTISGGSHPPCFVEKIINIPAFPNANFSISTNPVCQGSSTHFVVTNNVPGQTYNWAFGDDTFNLDTNPDKVYDAFDDYQPTLKVTNAYCTVEDSKPITVLANNQFGRIDDPLIACPGGSSILHFNSQGNPPSTTYQWLFNNQPIAGATYNDYPANLSGSYSLEVGADNLCKKRMSQSVPVAIAKPPFSEIQGPTVVCLGQEFTLFVKTGSGVTGLLYEWHRNDYPSIIFSYGPSVTDFLAVGTYEYRLTIKTPIASGGFCTTELLHTLTIIDQPEITNLYYVMNCEPSFGLTLFAEANSTDGVFNWSNGKTGASVTDNQGGPYEVTYTNSAGCKTKRRLVVPKNPENFMWIFPYGCYTFCDKFETGTLIGPSIVNFTKWNWQLDDVIAQQELSVDSPVRDYNLPSKDATYNLTLQVNDCKLKSQDMTVKVLNCNCTIAAELLLKTLNYEPFAHFILRINIGNTSSSNQLVTLTAGNGVGVMSPGSVLVRPGGGDFEFMLLPDSAYIGGLIKIKLNTTNLDGQLCEKRLEISLPPITPPGGGELRNGFTETSQNNSKLTLVPNPAKDQTQLQYDFGSAGHTGSQAIEVYDIYGRQLDHLAPENLAASWSLNTASYQVGIYIIVMKQDGKIIQQKNLIITH
jgi:PKD repeat protein